MKQIKKIKKYTIQLLGGMILAITTAHATSCWYYVGYPICKSGSQVDSVPPCGQNATFNVVGYVAWCQYAAYGDFFYSGSPSPHTCMVTVSGTNPCTGQSYSSTYRDGTLNTPGCGGFC